MISIKDKLVEIDSLCELLGVRDTRTVRKWCKENRIPLFTVGKRTYTISNFLDLFLDSQLKSFVEANYANPNAVMGAIQNDDKATLSTLLDAPVTVEVKKEFKRNQTRSKDAQDFLNQIKTA